MINRVAYITRTSIAQGAAYPTGVTPYPRSKNVGRENINNELTPLLPITQSLQTDDKSTGTVGEQEAERSIGHCRKLAEAFAIQTLEKAVTFAPKLLSLRQISQTQHPFNWSDTRWLSQMTSFSIIGGSAVTTASAEIFQNVSGRAQAAGCQHKLLLAMLVSLPAMAVFTVPFGYYEQKLQTGEATRFFAMFNADDTHQVLRRVPSWMAQKGLTRVGFMVLNELFVERLKFKHDKSRQMMLGLLLSVAIHSFCWPIHWLTVQFATDRYKDTSIGGILSDLYDNSDGNLKDIINTVYAGFLMHCLSYVLSGATEGLTLALLRAPDKGDVTSDEKDALAPMARQPSSGSDNMIV